MKIIAHRGASSYRTENTLAAFQLAIDMHSDGIELDVRLTKDGIPVISHDATINRLSNGNGFIHQMTLKELKKYKFGNQKDNQIATLEEFFDLIKDQQQMQIHLELKNGPVIPADLEEKVLKLSNDFRIKEQVVYSSFDHLSLQRLWKLDNTVKIGLLFHINLIHLFDYVDHTGLPIHSIHPNHFYVTNEMIEQAHERNMAVNVYTVNDKESALNLKNMGIDGLITNDPNIMNK